MKILHTADWHVGRMIRGRSRAGEHRAVLAEIAAVAAAEAVDLVLVVGDVFDSAAPPPEAEDIVYEALLALARTGATVIVLSGNHDNDKRLQALAPLLHLGGIVTRASFAPATAGGVVSGTANSGEPWRVAALPFLSQRWVVRAEDVLALDAGAHAGQYSDRVARLLAALTAGFESDAVNLVAAHAHVAGGLLGGGERLAHTIFQYAVSASAFPASAHYVALGHLHRAQAIAGPCPIRYSGSPLQLDFGETNDTKTVTVVEAGVGRPASARELPLASGRRLRTIRGSLAELDAMDRGTRSDPRSDPGGHPGNDPNEDWLKVIVRELPRIGLAEEVRKRFPTAVDVVVEDPTSPDRTDLHGKTSVSRGGRSPHELFGDYLKSANEPDPAVLSLFDRLLDEVTG